MEQQTHAVTYVLLQGDAGGSRLDLSWAERRLPPAGGRPVKDWAEFGAWAFDRPADAAAAALMLREAGLRIGLHTAPTGCDPWVDLAHTAAIAALAEQGLVLLSAGAARALQQNMPTGMELHSLGRYRLQDLRTIEAVFQLVRRGEQPVRPPLPSLESVPNNLPVQVTSFVGRRHEIGELKRLLLEHRLVTVTGPGGSGKTRLALQAAAQMLASFPDGIFLADLSALADATLIPTVVAAALRLQTDQRRPTLESLVEGLAGKRVLLLLDNCEHLITGCARLASTLLLSSPQVVILATSREPLGIAGELPWGLPALSLPPRGELVGAERLPQYDAIRLFTERATVAANGFALTEQNGPALAALCRRLDGIPLAIELAAARTRVLSVQQIAERLHDRLNLLASNSRTTAARHQTLREAIDWSYDLLAEDERTLWRRLSVFAGGFSLEAAEVVCSGRGVETFAVLDLLSQLVEKSLVATEEQGGAKRFRLLETMRQYARERLLEAGEGAALQESHLGWVTSLSETARKGLWSADLSTWLDRLELEQDNLREALQHAEQEGKADQAVRICGALWRFWYLRGYMQEHQERIQRLAGLAYPPHARRDLGRLMDGLGVFVSEISGDLAEGQRAFTRSIDLFREIGDPPEQISPLMNLGVLLTRHERYEEAAAHLEEAVRISRQAEDPVLIGLTLGLLGAIYQFKGEKEAARRSFHEAVTTQQRTGDLGGLRTSYLYLGHVAVVDEDYPVALHFYETALALSRASGDRVYLGSVLNGCGEAAYHLGEHEKAREYLVESLRICERIGDFLFLIHSLEAIGWVNAAEGRPELALHLEGGAAALRRRYGITPTAGRRRRMEAGVRPAYRQLDVLTARRAAAVGEALSRPEMVALASAPPGSLAGAGEPVPPAELEPPHQPVGSQSGQSPLTMREKEVVRLLALGLTAREIGQQLHLSPRTVEKHEENVRNKLNLSNRAALVVWAVRMGLVQTGR